MLSCYCPFSWSLELNFIWLHETASRQECNAAAPMAAAALHGELRGTRRMSENKLLRHQICHGRASPSPPVLSQRKARKRVIQLRTTPGIPVRTSLYHNYLRPCLCTNSQKFVLS